MMKKLLPKGVKGLFTIGFSFAVFLSFAYSSASVSEVITIELLSFEAHMNGSKIDLQWVTAYERNSDYYAVERSQDGFEFEEVMRVQGAGSSNMIVKYFDVDVNPVEGVSYYRLKQITTNGVHAYSSVVPVDFSSTGEPGLSIFGDTEINISASEVLNELINEEVLVVVRDEQGNEDYGKIVIEKAGKEIIASDAEGHLSKGVYLITGSSENVLYSRKLIIE